MWEEALLFAYIKMTGMSNNKEEIKKKWDNLD